MADVRSCFASLAFARRSSRAASRASASAVFLAGSSTGSANVTLRLSCVCGSSVRRSLLRTMKGSTLTWHGVQFSQSRAARSSPNATTACSVSFVHSAQAAKQLPTTASGTVSRKPAAKSAAPRLAASSVARFNASSKAWVSRTDLSLARLSSVRIACRSKRKLSSARSSPSREASCSAVSRSFAPNNSSCNRCCSAACRPPADAKIHSCQHVANNSFAFTRPLDTVADCAATRQRPRARHSVISSLQAPQARRTR
mmetsp:Transcript_100465/g.225151  ORF Transcript_100465/g.225151 Transcript_100465/m.225151 type:complete len:256 (+) Transcript_100465:324-1091(+)